MRTVVPSKLVVGLLIIPPLPSTQTPAEPQTKQPGVTRAPTKDKSAAVKTALRARGRRFRALLRPLNTLPALHTFTRLLASRAIERTPSCHNSIVRQLCVAPGDELQALLSFILQAGAR